MKNKETDKRRLNNFKTEKSKNLKRGKMKNWRGANWKTKIGKSKVENTWGAPGGRRPSPADRNLYFRKKSVFLGAWAASALRTGCNGSAPANFSKHFAQHFAGSPWRRGGPRWFSRILQNTSGGSVAPPEAPNFFEFFVKRAAETSSFPENSKFAAAKKP